MFQQFEPDWSIGPLPFVGRESEIQKLISAHHDAYNGGRIIAWIAGEMGSGRSRLLDELRSRNGSERGMVVRMRANREDAAAPLAPLATALVEAIGALPALRRNMETVLPEMTSPRLSAASLGRALDMVARRMLLLLVIDDIDAAGEGLAVELGEVLAEIEGPFFAIVISGPGFGETVATMGRACEAEIVPIAVQPLEKGDIVRVLSETFDIIPEEEDAQWLCDATHGLPVLLREAVHAVVRSGCIVFKDNRWHRSESFEHCPFSAADALPALREQIGELPDDERRTLAAMALAGRRIPEQWPVMLNLTEERLAPLLARDLLACNGHSLEFPHELLYEMALAEARHLQLHEQLHEQLLRLIELSTAPGAGFWLSRFTLHLMAHNASRQERARLLETLLTAGPELIRQDEWSAAAAYFDEVYVWRNELRELRDDVQLAGWIVSYSQVLYRLGRIPDQQAMLQEFLAQFEDSPPPQELIRSIVLMMLSVVENFYRQKQIDAALALLDRASMMLGGMEGEEKTALENAIALHRGETLRVADRHNEARIIFRAILERSDPETFSPRAFEALMSLEKLPQSMEDRAFLLAQAGTMLELCDRKGLRRAAVQIRAMFANIFHIAEGNLRSMEPAIMDLIRDTRSCGLPRTESNAWYWLAVISAIHGDYADALRKLERTIEIRWRVRSIAMWQVALITKARILVAYGRHSEALALLDELEDDARHNNRPCRRFNIEICRALIAIRERQVEIPRERIAELRAIGQAEGFEATESSLLELEGEMMLRSASPGIREAEGYIKRVAALPVKPLFNRMLYVIAAAVAGRTMDKGSSGQKRRSVPALLHSAATLALEALNYWKEREAPHQIARALPLLRTHAHSMIAAEELAAFNNTEDGSNGDVAHYDFEVVTLGRMRVLDRSGAECGARHFGTHKSDSKPRKILAALATAAVQGRRLSRERLIEMVWGEGGTGETTTNNFHVTLSGLRQVIGDGIDFDGTAYALNMGVMGIDAVKFLERITEGMAADRNGKTFRAYDLLLDACDLYTGEFLEGIYDEWIDAPRDFLRAKARAALLRLAELALLRGEHDVARGCVGRLLEMDAADEEAIYLQLSILDLEGERLRALREYDRFTALLREEYGVNPSRRLQELRTAIAEE